MDNIDTLLLFTILFLSNGAFIIFLIFREEYIKKFLINITTFWEKWWRALVGMGAYRIFNWIYDNPIWISVQLTWGETGVKAMIILSILLNATFIIFFRERNTEFIGWTLLDRLVDKQVDLRKKYFGLLNGGLWNKCKFIWGIPIAIAVFSALWILHRFPKHSDAIAQIFLPIIEDPFVATEYLRHGRKGRLRSKDWLVFSISCVIGLSYWTVRNTVLSEIIRPVFELATAP